LKIQQGVLVRIRQRMKRLEALMVSEEVKVEARGARTLVA